MQPNCPQCEAYAASQFRAHRQTIDDLVKQCLAYKKSMQDALDLLDRDCETTAKMTLEMALGSWKPPHL